METARDKSRGKPIANNTRLYEIHNPLMLDTGGIGGYEIRLHGNLIVRILRHHIEILDGGWKTRTTKERLNKCLISWSRSPRGIYVYRKDYEWYLRCGDDTYDFDDVCWIHNDGRVMLHSTHPNYPKEEKEMETKMEGLE